MGGYSSGRYRERNRGTVDAAIRLDLRAMRRQGFLHDSDRYEAVV